MILFQDVLVLEKNMVAFGAAREIQRKFRKWIWWPELAGNGQKPPEVNSGLVLCWVAVRHGGGTAAGLGRWGQSRPDHYRREDRTGWSGEPPVADASGVGCVRWAAVRTKGRGAVRSPPACVL